MGFWETLQQNFSSGPLSKYILISTLTICGSFSGRLFISFGFWMLFPPAKEKFHFLFFTVYCTFLSESFNLSLLSTKLDLAPYVQRSLTLRDFLKR